MTKTVRAAGGLVLRKTDKGNVKVLVVHRPRYDDWSLPKGKMEKGETSEETAVREVLEETGQHCRIVEPLEITRYRVGRGVKEVAWYAMRPLPDSPGFTKNSEVDEIAWLSPKQAAKKVDYDFDRSLILNEELKKVAETGTLFFVRHAAAGNRDKWKKEDRIRPVTKKGRRQSEAIADYLEGRGVERILTSPYLRCVQTVDPLAARIGAKVEKVDALAEGPDVDAAYDLVHGLVGSNAVLCSHGDVIPAAMNRLMWMGLSLHSGFYCSKASIWEVGVERGRFTDGVYVPPPEI